jgi:hypothetical protein
MTDDAWPREDSVYVLKEGRRLGPFTLDDLLDGLESGDFSEDDVCLRDGATDLERLRDLLDWDEAEHEEDDDDDTEEEAEEDDFDEEFDEEDDDFDDEEDWPEDPEPSPATRGDLNQRPSKPAGTSVDRLLYAGHPSVLSYPVSLAALVGGVTGGIWLYGLDPKLTLAALGLATAGLIRLSLVRYCHDYHIHTRRIESVVGLLARSSREVRIEDIRAIHVTCRGLSGLLGIGSIDFHTSGDAPEITFHRVWAARKIKTLVRRLQDAA